MLDWNLNQLHSHISAPEPVCGGRQTDPVMICLLLFFDLRSVLTGVLLPQVLSRAFRNRFVELHFDELPSEELETILHQRCSLPPSYCSKLVRIMQDLQVTVVLYAADSFRCLL